MYVYFLTDLLSRPSLEIIFDNLFNFPMLFRNSNAQVQKRIRVPERIKE